MTFGKLYSQLSFCLLLSLLIGLSACSTKKIDLSGQNDPNLWLEDVEGKKSIDWVKDQNAKTMKALTQSPHYKDLKQRALSVLQANDKIPELRLMGGYLYNFLQDSKHVRGVWRRIPRNQLSTKKKRWQILLDIDELAKKDKENWVFKDAKCLPPLYNSCLIHLSRGGKDATVVREFNVAQKQFVKNGFVLPEAKTEVNWMDQDTVLVATNFGQGSLTESGYARIVKKWKRGQPLEQAKTIKEVDAKNMLVYGYTQFADDRKVTFVADTINFYSNHIYVYEKELLKEIPMPPSAMLLGYFKGDFVFQIKDEWLIGQSQYQAGSLVAIKHRVIDSQKVSEADVTLLFEPKSNMSVVSSHLLKDKILINVLENIYGRFYEVEKRTDGYSTAKPVDVKVSGNLSVVTSSDKSNDFYFTSEDYLKPLALHIYKGDIKKNEVLVKQKEKFNAKGMVAQQKWATSKDGTKISYFVVGKKSVLEKGGAPTMLHGYGGFEVSYPPDYRPIVGQLWLREGGIFVFANIRGGGEFGPNWHNAAILKQRHKAYDDFIAVAQDLIRTNVTTREKLAIQGRSNGGLLVGAVMVRRPDLFKAVVCQVPLLDMLRYSQLLAGASWMAEYGDPRDPEMAEYLLSYSPYHNLKKEVNYPDVLFMTSTKDDRVHPGHARKMAYKMKSMGLDNILYYENMEGGHKGGADLKQWAQWNALFFEFMYQKLK